jgi:hypothetical protein
MAHGYIPDYAARRKRVADSCPSVPGVQLPPEPPIRRTVVRIRSDPTFLAGVLDRLRNNQNTERVSVSRLVIDHAIEELLRLAELERGGKP